MTQPSEIDSALIEWGERLFYPANRIVKVRPTPRLSGGTVRQRADAIRQRIEATVVRGAPQVMVKVTGGGRGMKAIAAHLRYISKNGRLEIEDERGEKILGQDATHSLADDWRFGGTRIDDVSDRREAFNIMLSMPRGTDPLIVQKAAREFAKEELADHKLVMVLHDHQANPHVHISVRAESKHGKRLNPRKADLHRWRETFAEKLRDWGIDAEATRQSIRGSNRSYEALWRIKARTDARLRIDQPIARSSPNAHSSGVQAEAAWTRLSLALSSSADKADLELARRITAFVHDMASLDARSVALHREPQANPQTKAIDVEPRR